MRVDTLSLFPEMFSALNYGITGRAKQQRLIQLQHWSLRQFASQGRVDDSPYGGGPGMVMQVEPLRKAIYTVRQQQPGPVIYLSPQGQPLTQAAVQKFSQGHGFILLAGRYEGIDQRILERDVDEQWSIGDYILSGGELAAMVLLDAVIRLLPHALGHADSTVEESFSQGLLEYPHYTRPASIDAQAVPAILLTGNHQAIAKWRHRRAIEQTWQQRPDLLASRILTAEEQQWIAACIESTPQSR